LFPAHDKAVRRLPFFLTFQSTWISKLPYEFFVNRSARRVTLLRRTYHAAVRPRLPGYYRVNFYTFFRPALIYHQMVKPSPVFFLSSQTGYRMFEEWRAPGLYIIKTVYA
jgi:hypothetical protein